MCVNTLCIEGCPLGQDIPLINPELITSDSKSRVIKQAKEKQVDLQFYKYNTNGAILRYMEAFSRPTLGTHKMWARPFHRIFDPISNQQESSNCPKLGVISDFLGQKIRPGTYKDISKKEKVYAQCKYTFL